MFVGIYRKTEVTPIDWMKVPLMGVFLCDNDPNQRTFVLEGGSVMSNENDGLMTIDDSAIRSKIYLIRGQ